jgi:signal transduction histidine kinase
LALAHAVWLVVVLLDLAVFIPGALLYDRALHMPCSPHGSQPCLALGPLSPSTVQTLARLGVTLDLYAALSTAIVLMISAVFFALGAVVAWRKWRDSLGLLVSLLLITFGANGIFGAFQSVDSQVLPSVSPAQAAILNSIVGASLFIVQWPALGAFLLTFPTGRFSPRWSWLLVGLWITNFFAFILVPPLIVTVGSVVVTYGSIVVIQIYRYRRVYGPVERQQAKWLVFSLGVAVGLQIVLGLALALVDTQGAPSSALADLLASFINAFVGAATFILIAAGVTVALLRYRLYDIDLIINRTLVYAALTACVIGIYVLIVGYLGAALRVGSNPVISLVAAAVVAVLFQPLRERFQRGTNRLLFGERDDPYGVLARLDTQLAFAIPTEAVLPTIVVTIATALKLPYAVISLAGHEPTAGTAAPALHGRAAADKASDGPNAAETTAVAPPGMQKARMTAAYGSPLSRGDSDTPLLQLPLSYGAETVGYLELAPRSGERSFSAADKRLLDNLAAHAGLVVHAVSLTADLQRARERLVTTREEERRRLRRDLHDGLGPQLASLTLTLTAARQLLARDPAAADSLLVELAKHIQSAVRDIRRLVYELRPPALDDLGLVGALRDQAARAASGGLDVRVEVGTPLVALPAAVEVAVYRVCVEALTNVTRHAQAHRCRIRLDLEHEPSRALIAEVIDDGIGLVPGRVAGVGLRSMRERAEELGGRWAVEALPGGGTRVCAHWPLPDAEA